MSENEDLNKLIEELESTKTEVPWFITLLTYAMLGSATMILIYFAFALMLPSK